MRTPRITPRPKTPHNRNSYTRTLKGGRTASVRHTIVGLGGTPNPYASKRK